VTIDDPLAGARTLPVRTLETDRSPCYGKPSVSNLSFVKVLVRELVLRIARDLAHQ
jgi:hypothetical protein